MAPKHLCPNCGTLRAGPVTECPECRYPNHKRESYQPHPKNSIKHPPFRFHIATLLAATTIAAVACAIANRWGLDGLGFAFRIVAIFAPIIEFIIYFWINLGSDNSNAIDDYDNRFQ